MGLSAALRAARSGASVTLLEAGLVGSGASSKPGGFVVPHFSVGSPAEVVARVGTGGEQLVRMVGNSAARVFELIAETGIQCDAKQGGWYQPAHSTSSLRRIQTLAAEWQDYGLEVDLLDAAETAFRTGTKGYCGSWYTPSGGTIHPLKYCRGLADAAVAAGCHLYENSPVCRVDDCAGHMMVHTAQGCITADRVVVCTNGLSRKLVPSLSDSIVPLKVHQCATFPLQKEALERLFSKGECLSDTRRNLFTYRLDADGRLITGALDTLGVSPARAARKMAVRLSEMLRLDEVPMVEFLWSGVSSLSASRLPATVVEDGRLIAASSCNARGIALSTVVGEALADFILGGEKLFLPRLSGVRPASARAQQRMSRLYPHVAPLLDWAESSNFWRKKLDG